MAGSGKEHAPRHRYDCGRCKFSWCCGPCCDCPLRELPGPPPARARRVRAARAKWRAKRGYQQAPEERL